MHIEILYKLYYIILGMDRIFYLAGAPARYPVAGYPVSGEKTGRIAGFISAELPKYIKLGVVRRNYAG